MGEVQYNQEHRLSYLGKHVLITQSRDGNMVFSLFDQQSDEPGLTVYISKGEEFMRFWDFLKNNFRGSTPTAKVIK